ncbi:translation initiation factor IF-2-like [Schistocerca americana]|uniref:translation initiation factor IF-2-like n=1 Tax=Schistocerca americana TaxID=7009 RepID=UPI001F4F480D|nr:translation initiation factor IF-2-like [Schistocerca americana]
MATPNRRPAPAALPPQPQPQPQPPPAAPPPPRKIEAAGDAARGRYKHHHVRRVNDLVLRTETRTGAEDNDQRAVAAASPREVGQRATVMIWAGSAPSRVPDPTHDARRARPLLRASPPSKRAPTGGQFARSRNSTPGRSFSSQREYE